MLLVLVESVPEILQTDSASDINRFKMFTREFSFLFKCLHKITPDPHLFCQLSNEAFPGVREELHY